MRAAFARYRVGHALHTTVVYVALVAATLIALFPFYWGLITSFKSTKGLLELPPTWYPSNFTLDNFDYVWNRTSLPTAIVNSFVITSVTTLIALALAFHAAYASIRLSFRGRSVGLFILLATVMVPVIVTLVPQYLIAARLGLVDTKRVLVVLFTAWQIPFAIWILRAHFARIPEELEDAARVDGCTRLGALYRVTLPLAWPGISAAAIVIFVWVWNEFIVAATLTSSDSTEPVSASLYQFVSETGVEWGRLSAGAVLALLPPIVLFVILQRRFVEGLSSGAGK
jgi:ABC-type glycerol-3-phosphate transport system permease component